MKRKDNKNKKIIKEKVLKKQEISEDLFTYLTLKYTFLVDLRQ